MSKWPLDGVEDQNALLMDSLADCAVFLLDPAGRVAGWNAGAERLLGYREEEVLSQSGTCFFSPEDVSSGEPEKELRTATEAGRASNLRWQVRKDGGRIWVRCIITSLKDAAGGLGGFAKAVQDRTEQRLAEDAVRASERRYRILAENAWDGVTLVAADGTILETTPITFGGLGYTPEEYIGQNAFSMIHPEDERDTTWLRSLAALPRHAGASTRSFF